MKMKIALSMVVILIVVAASIGATMAWFTDSAEVAENTFIAGTVTLDAEETFFGATEGSLSDWNPGDCSPKYVKVEYTGSKNALLRMQIDERWEDVGALIPGVDPDPSIEDYDYGLSFDPPYDDDDYIWNGDPDAVRRNVHWKVYTGELEYTVDENDNSLFTEVNGKIIVKPEVNPENNPGDWEDFDLEDGNWTYIKGYWYYNDILEGGENKSFDIISLVCIDGAETGNEYQGATYKIGFSFEAIQASNEASNDAWGVEWDGESWVTVSSD